MCCEWKIHTDFLDLIPKKVKYIIFVTLLHIEIIFQLYWVEYSILLKLILPVYFYFFNMLLKFFKLHMWLTFEVQIIFVLGSVGLQFPEESSVLLSLFCFSLSSSL